MAKDVFFVVAQFLAILALFYLVGLFPGKAWQLLFHILGFSLGIWAIYSMSNSKLNISPKVKSGSKLIKSGPYKWIRHPMYSALLLFFLPHASHSTTSFVVYFFLFITLILKLRYEEKLLLQAFMDYESYRKNSHALIPYLF